MKSSQQNPQYFVETTDGGLDPLTAQTKFPRYGERDKAIADLLASKKIGKWTKIRCDFDTEKEALWKDLLAALPEDRQKIWAVVYAESAGLIFLTRYIESKEAFDKLYDELDGFLMLHLLALYAVNQEEYDTLQNMKAADPFTSQSEV